LSKDVGGNVWSALAYLSQHFDLGPEILRKAREIVLNPAPVAEEGNQEVGLGYMEYVGLIASAQHDIELAQAIGDKVLASVSAVQSDSDVATVISILLVASAVFEDDDAWVEWIENQLAEVAMRLPAGDLSGIFLRYLHEIKKVVKLNMGVLSRAEAFAASAV